MTPKQKEIVELMKDGWLIRKFWTFVGHDNKDVCHIYKGKEYKNLHMRTFNSLFNEGIIVFDHHDHKWDGYVYVLKEGI